MILKLFTLYLFLFFSFCFFTLSCTQIPDSNQEKVTSNSKEYLYGNTSFKFPAFSEKAKEQLIKWAIFEDFEMQAKTINGSTIEDLKNKTDILITYSDSLTKKMPDTLKIQPILSRIIVLQTRSQLLHLELNKSRLDSIKIQKSIQNLNHSINNLVLQINEKFQKDHIDFNRKEDEQKELEKQKQFLDSVYKSELKDQKK
ncbi:MAG: hypothetical protein ACWA45_06680 [Flavobacteriales bacterium]